MELVFFRTEGGSIECGTKVPFMGTKITRLQAYAETQAPRYLRDLVSMYERKIALRKNLSSVDRDTAFKSSVGNKFEYAKGGFQNTVTILWFASNGEYLGEAISNACTYVGDASPRIITRSDAPRRTALVRVIVNISGNDARENLIWKRF